MGLANIVKIIRFCSLFYRRNENFRVILGTDLDNLWNYVPSHHTSVVHSSRDVRSDHIQVYQLFFALIFFIIIIIE